MNMDEIIQIEVRLMDRDEKFKMDTKITANIRTLKQRISKITQLPLQSLILKYQGESLEKKGEGLEKQNDLKELKFEMNSIIEVYQGGEIQKPNNYNIVVLKATGEEYPVVVRLGERLTDIKEQMYQFTGIKPEYQRFIYKGKDQMDEDIVDKYEPNTYLYMVWRNPSG